MRARWRSYRWGGWQPAFTGAAAPAPGPVSYSFGLLTGLLGVVLAFVRAILGIVFLAFLFMLVTTGSLGYGFDLEERWRQRPDLRLLHLEAGTAP